MPWAPRTLLDALLCRPSQRSGQSTRRAFRIDTVYEQFERDKALLSEFDLELTHTLETRVHAPA